MSHSPLVQYERVSPVPHTDPTALHDTVHHSRIYRLRILCDIISLEEDDIQRVWARYTVFIQLVKNSFLYTIHYNICSCLDLHDVLVHHCYYCFDWSCTSYIFIITH